MDSRSFDQLSRRLGASRTRRQALRAIAGAVVAGVAGITATEAQACTAHHKRCGSDGQCCSGAVCEYGRCMPGCRIDGAYHPAGMSPGGDICQVCAPEVSTTAWSPANDGVPCWSGSANAGATTCQRGACAPVAVVTPVPCPPLTPCHLAGQVDPATGMCVHPPAPAGTPCGIGEMCHGGVYQPADACDGNGFCIGGGSKAVNCEPVDVCTPARCSDSACNSVSDCPDGTVCKTATATCQDPCSCTDAVISSSATDLTLPVRVDDDLRVYVNGSLAYEDIDTFETLNVIPLGPVTRGDTIRVYAFDPVFGIWQILSPLYLHCRDDGQFLQTLDAEGYAGRSEVWEPVVPFYDETFAITCAG